MRIEPTKLAIVEFGVKRNLVAGIVRNVEAIVRSVRGPRRDQMDVNHGASGPGISFVDGIAVAIDLERTVEVGARLDRTFAIVFDFAAPENRLAFFIGGLQLEPDIEGVHCAAGEEVADLARAHNHIHTGVIAAANGGVCTIDGSSNGADFAGGAFRKGSIRFFANGEGGREYRLSKFAVRRDVSFFACRRNRENIHGELLVLQEFLGELVLCLVLVGCGNSRVRAGEAMRMHESFHISVIERRDRRHVTIGAVHGRLWIVEGARSLAGDAAGLPIVIFIEAANPPVAIHRDIEVDFVAGRTELRSIRAHERLQESAAMRFRIEANDKIVQLADEKIFAGGEFMELRIFQEEIALAHGALHFHDAVAHQAAKAGARFRAVNDLLDGRIEEAAVKQRGIVAAGAPLGGTNAGDILHVLDTLAVPLIVEGREMVHRAVPLLVNVRMAALASVGFHEVLGGNVATMFSLRGTGEEFSLGAVAFAVHGFRGHQRIGNVIRVLPGDLAGPPCAGGDGGA